MDDDHIYGGIGADILSGGSGNDIIDGGSEDDDIDGGSGNDSIDAGEGNDTVTGGEGDDILHGNDGDDTITAGLGEDTITGGQGSDAIDGSDGDDTITAGLGADTITGGQAAISLSLPMRTSWTSTSTLLPTLKWAPQAIYSTSAISMQQSCRTALVTTGLVPSLPITMATSALLWMATIPSFRMIRMDCMMKFHRRLLFVLKDIQCRHWDQIMFFRLRVTNSTLSNQLTHCQKTAAQKVSYKVVLGP